eukprot:TRINITY_DN36979_c0_g1_i1.p1 TRINITY_DN36979_c0_g1~~TRINITY_DN36979_c0_g1_i1.p1  ORF type:complete len:183 (+),score=38.78 TRINITY_DN36979_c0_g1_i1:107-655(+)
MAAFVMPLAVAPRFHLKRPSVTLSGESAGPAGAIQVLQRPAPRASGILEVGRQATAALLVGICTAVGQQASKRRLRCARRNNASLEKATQYARNHNLKPLGTLEEGMKRAQENAPKDEAVKGLLDWLWARDLEAHYPAVNEWCKEMGAADFVEVAENASELADYLGDALTPDEKKELKRGFH